MLLHGMSTNCCIVHTQAIQLLNWCCFNRTSTKGRHTFVVDMGFHTIAQKVTYIFCRIALFAFLSVLLCAGYRIYEPTQINSALTRKLSWFITRQHNSRCTDCSTLKHEQKTSPSLHPAVVLFSSQCKKNRVCFRVYDDNHLEWHGIGTNGFKTYIGILEVCEIFFLSEKYKCLSFENNNN